MNKKYWIPVLGYVLYETTGMAPGKGFYFGVVYHVACFWMMLYCILKII